MRKNDTNNELPLGASLFTIFLCMLFGANAVAIKISLFGLGVFTTIVLRFSIAALALYTWAKATNKPLAISRVQVYQQLLIASVFFIQMSAFYLGLNQTTASHGTLIANFLPFVVMVFAHFFLPADKINIKKLIGLFLGFMGVFLLLFDEFNYQTNTVIGDLTILFAIFLWGFNVVYIKRIIADYHPVQITLYPMVFSAPLFFITALLCDKPMVQYLSFEIISAILYQSLITASFGFVMWNTLIQRYGATALHSFIFIMPLSGVCLGILVLGEPITSNLIGSICFVTLGLFVVNYRPNTQRTSKRPK